MKAPGRVFVIALLLFGSFPLFCQTSYTLSGKVIAEDYSPLQSASVFIAQFSTGSFSDSLGEFTVKLPAGWNEVSFSYVGYKVVKLKLFMQRDTIVEIPMKYDLTLGEVTIVDKKKLKAADHDETGVITMRKENFLSLPAMLGENDPMRAVQMQPGVQSGNEGARGIFVRGGSPDQNLMLLDGATVYNPSHLYGFVSVFNSDAVEQIAIYKDRYPARFGGRLGSVMCIETDAGNSNRLRGSFTFGLLTSRFHLDGPIGKKKKTTFSISIRGCYAGLYTSPISKHQYKAAGYTGDIAYYFGDANLKLGHRFSERDKIEVSFFHNSDYYSFKKSNGQHDTVLDFNSTFLQQVNWSNYVSSFSWVHTFNPKWRTKTLASYTDYEITSKQSDHYIQQATSTWGSYKSIFDNKSSMYIREVALNEDIEFTPAGLQTFRGGVMGRYQFFETGKSHSNFENSWSQQSGQTSSSHKSRAIETAYYIEDELKPNEHWLINCGFHARTYTATKTFFNFLPRLNVIYSPVKNLWLRASGAGVSQNLHLLATSTSNVLNDYWVPATAIAKPETGWNLSGGIMQKLPLNFEWSVDGFYRTMNNLIDYAEGASYASSTKSWEEQIVTGGSGRAYGLEVYAARSYGRITGSIAYTLSWSERKFSTLNDGNYFPYKYDRRHNIALQVNFLASKHFELGLAWAYGSGNMFTMPLQSYNSWNGMQYYDYLVQQGQTKPSPAEEITVYTGKNGYRLPAYHHLDLSFTYKKKAKLVEHILNLSIYNVYNRMNIFSVYSDYRTDSTGGRQQVFKQLSLFPILPSLAYTIKFGAAS